MSNVSINVKWSPMLHVKNHPRLSGSIIALVPGTMVGLKMKEACYLDPGWRVLTCLCPNTRPCSERHTSLWAGDEGRKELLCGRKYMLCMWGCVYVHVCTCAPASLCVHVHEYSSTAQWEGLQLSIGKK